MSNAEQPEEVVITNITPRFSGVTASIIAVTPPLQKLYRIRALGGGLPKSIERISWWHFLRHYRRKERVIWHARRNIEMLPGIIFKKLGYPIILLWTSAAQRRHKWLTRLLYNRMDYIIATTKAAASYLDKPSIVVNHGVDSVTFCPPENREKQWQEKGLKGKYGIGIFGRIRPQKGTEEYIDALCEVLPSYPDWTGILIGETTPKFLSFRQRLEEKVEKAGLKDRIVFIGKVKDFADIPKWYQALSLVIVPPWNEGFGLTCLEAMASNCPVIATQTGAFPEIIETDKNGWVVPCRDAKALAEALRNALKDPEKLKEMGTYARQHVENHFPIEKEAENISKVYEKIFAEYKK